MFFSKSRASVIPVREHRHSPGRPAPAARRILVIVLAAVAGGGGSAGDGARAASTVFRDVTRASGIRFTHRYDIRNGKMIVTQGGGAAFADYDGDGRLDLYTVNSVARSGKDNAKNCSVLWHNEGIGSRGIPRFRDATAGSGIRACGWGQGAYWIDIDGDGDSDLFQTNFGRNQLFINRGAGARPHFEDRSAESGLGDTEGFHVGAGFLDADRDGDVDLYVADYLVTDLAFEKRLSGFDLLVPEDYPAASNHLYVNDGTGRFADRTEPSGTANSEGRSLGVAPQDYDGDGWTDIFVANDKTPNALFRNNRDGTFTDVAVESNCAFNENGIALSGMGVAVGDFNTDGLPDIFVTNYAPEWNTLYMARGGGRFEDATGPSGLGPPSLDPVGWGTGVIDFDNDGKLDLYVNNGNILPFWLIRLAKVFAHEKKKVEKYAVGKTYRQKPLLFRGRGDGTFEDVTDSSGDLSRQKLVGRGSAAGDVDGDGDLDLFLLDTAGMPFGKRPSPLLLNDGGNRAHAIAVRLMPGPNGRTPLGALVTVEAGGARQTREWQIQPAYASGSDVPLWFGLGDADHVDRMTVSWPGGKIDVHETLEANAVWRVSPDGRAEIAARFRAASRPQ